MVLSFFRVGKLGLDSGRESSMTMKIDQFWVISGEKYQKCLNYFRYLNFRAKNIFFFHFGPYLVQFKHFKTIFRPFFGQLLDHFCRSLFIQNLLGHPVFDM